jgi:outer membrane murein-binding lipoprotein Lpp
MEASLTHSDLQAQHMIANPMLQGGLGPEEVDQLQQELTMLNAKLAQLEQGSRDKDASVEAGLEALEATKQRLDLMKLENKQLKAKVRMGTTK